MASPDNPVVDAQRSSRWPVIIILLIGALVIGGGLAYDRFVTNAPIVLTPTKPNEPTTKGRPAPSTQSTSPSTQPTRPPSQSRPAPSSSDGIPDWLPMLFGLLPLVFVGVMILAVVTVIRRVRRAATQMTTAGSAGHWVGGKHVGTAGAGSGSGGLAGPWQARQPGTTNANRSPPPAQAEPVKRKGGGFPLLPIVIGAVILDQFISNGRYSREVLNWIIAFVEGFLR